MAKDIETAKRFLAMSRGTRADALVGRYLSLYAFVEYGVNRAIALFLDTDIVSWTIITRNMGFAEKVQSLRAMNSFCDDGSQFNALNTRLMDHAKVRNVIAHCTFAPSKTSDGVVFMHFRASNKLAAVSDDWPVKRMLKEYQELRETAKQLTAFSKTAETYRQLVDAARRLREAGAVVDPFG